MSFTPKLDDPFPQRLYKVDLKTRIASSFPKRRYRYRWSVPLCLFLVNRSKKRWWHPKIGTVDESIVSVVSDLAGVV